jgi:uncharacterized membrane protein
MPESPSLISMFPPYLKWIASLVFGYFIGQSSFTVFNPIVSALLGIHNLESGVVMMSTIDKMLYIVTALSLLVGIAAMLFLSRSKTFYQVLGKGCVLLGITLLVSLVTTSMTIGQEFTDTSFDDSFIFWVLLFGLPYLVSGAALIIIGKIVLHKDRKKQEALAGKSV